MNIVAHYHLRKAIEQVKRYGSEEKLNVRQQLLEEMSKNGYSRKAKWLLALFTCMYFDFMNAPLPNSIEELEFDDCKIIAKLLKLKRNSYLEKWDALTQPKQGPEIWSPEIDEIILECINSDPKNLKKSRSEQIFEIHDTISSKLGFNLSEDVIRRKYNACKDSNADKFSNEEDDMIINFIQMRQRHWDQFVTKFKNRTIKQLQHRFKILKLKLGIRLRYNYAKHDQEQQKK